MVVDIVCKKTLWIPEFCLTDYVKHTKWIPIVIDNLCKSNMNSLFLTDYVTHHVNSYCFWQIMSTHIWFPLVFDILCHVLRRRCPVHPLRGLQRARSDECDGADVLGSRQWDNAVHLNVPCKSMDRSSDWVSWSHSEPNRCATCFPQGADLAVRENHMFTMAFEKQRNVAHCVVFFKTLVKRSGFLQAPTDARDLLKAIWNYPVQ